MNRYRYTIRVYRDDTGQMAEFIGWLFPDKEAARKWGEDMGWYLYQRRSPVRVSYDGPEEPE